MLGLTLFATAIFTFGSAAILYAVATSDPALMPATVNPFGSPRVSDPAADTLELANATAATLTGDWHTNEVKSLREAEDVLDWLENHHVRHAEMTNANGMFQIRWR
jgi:hypothetical protein